MCPQSSTIIVNVPLEKWAIKGLVENTEEIYICFYLVFFHFVTCGIHDGGNHSLFLVYSLLVVDIISLSTSHFLCFVYLSITHNFLEWLINFLNFEYR